MNADQGKRVSRRGRRGAERRKHGQCGREGTAPQRIRRSRRKEEGTTDAHRWTQIAEAGHGQDERDRQDSEETAAVPSSFVIGHSSFRRGPTPPEHRASRTQDAIRRLRRWTQMRRRTGCTGCTGWVAEQPSSIRHSSFRRPRRRTPPTGRPAPQTSNVDSAEKPSHRQDIPSGIRGFGEKSLPLGGKCALP